MILSLNNFVVTEFLVTVNLNCGWLRDLRSLKEDIKLLRQNASYS